MWLPAFLRRRRRDADDSGPDPAEEDGDRLRGNSRSDENLDAGEVESAEGKSGVRSLTKYERNREEKQRMEMAIQKAIKDTRERRVVEQRVQAIMIRQQEAEDEKPKSQSMLGDATVSNEIPVACSLFVKGLVFFILFVGGLFVATNNYNLAHCATTSLTSTEGICVRAFTVDGGISAADAVAAASGASVNQTRCIGISDANCNCAQFESSRPNPRDREGCTYRTLLSGGSVTNTVSCLGYDAFRDQCEDKRSCPASTVTTLGASMTIYGLVFGLMSVPALAGGYGLIYFRGLHPNDFFGPLSRVESLWLMFAKMNRPIIQALFVFHLLTFGFAFYALSVVNDRCPDAETVEGDKWQMAQDASNLLFLGVFLVFGYGAFSTWVACNCPVRGELINPQRDAGRECSDSVADCCCCRKYRARADSDVRICRYLTRNIKALCPRRLKSCTFEVLRFIFNTVFLLTCEPVGWLLQTCWDNRHYVSP